MEVSLLTDRGGQLQQQRLFGNRHISLVTEQAAGLDIQDLCRYLATEFAGLGNFQSILCTLSPLMAPLYGMLVGAANAELQVGVPA